MLPLSACLSASPAHLATAAAAAAASCGVVGAAAAEPTGVSAKPTTAAAKLLRSGQLSAGKRAVTHIASHAQYSSAKRAWHGGATPTTPCSGASAGGASSAAACCSSRSAARAQAHRPVAAALADATWVANWSSAAAASCSGGQRGEPTLRSLHAGSSTHAGEQHSPAAFRLLFPWEQHAAAASSAHAYLCQ